MSEPETNEDATDLHQFYQNLHLPSNRKCIRLLHVYGSVIDGRNQIIKGNMTVADLDASPSFAALSYVWGAKNTEHRPTSISCSGHSIPVTPKCFAAVAHLQKKFGSFTIWIDAVCIDQSNDYEKSQQIPLMGEIYSRATEAYIWLGESDEATTRAMTFLGSAGFLEYVIDGGSSSGPLLSSPHIWSAAWSALTSYCSLKRHPFPFIIREPPRLWSIPYLQRIREKHGAVYTSYQDLNELLTREWTRRIWTYQEIILSRNPVVVCGDEHLPWARFTLSILFLDHIKARRLANFTGPRNIIFKTWKKVILTRLRLFENEPDAGLLSTAKGDSSSAENLTLEDVRKYQRFLYDVFSRCLLLCRTITALAYLSAANLLVSIVVAARLNPATLFAYLAVSVVIFGTLFFGYATMTYSYYHRTFYAMPFYNQWLSYMKEDEDDDFIDAIISRKATDPKDMAFGLHAVLERKMRQDLPVPNYALSIGKIYKDLTVNIVTSTNQLNFLIPAAGNPLSESPSWVPDWAGNFPTYWLQPFLANYAYEKLFTLPNQNANCLPPWKLDPSEPDKLTIWAFRYCTISGLFTLQKTMPTYDESQREIHIKNITIMMQFFKNGHKVELDYFTNRLNYPDLPTDINPDIIRLIWTVFRSSKFVDAETILNLLLMQRSMTFPFPYGFSLPLYLRAKAWRLFDMYINVCDAFIDSGRNFFSAKGAAANSGDDIMGVCTSIAQAGDEVVYIPSLPSLLTVRTVSSCKGRMRLIGPAVVFSYVEKDLQATIKRQKKQDEAEVMEPIDLI